MTPEVGGEEIMKDISITLVQTNLFWEDITANLALFDTLFETVPDDTDLLVLPEMFTTGFSLNASTLAQKMDGPAVEWMRDASRRKQADIVGSMIIEDGGGYLNRLIWVRPAGELLYYDKRHLFRMAGEEKVYRFGEKHLTVDLRGWKLRPFVCYDLRFPVWTRNMDNVYDAAIFVANWPGPRSNHWRTLLAARAIENQAYVIGVNRVGSDNEGRVFKGDSSVFDPGGEALAQMGSAPGTHTVRLSAETLKNYRESFPAWMDADRNMVDWGRLENN